MLNLLVLPAVSSNFGSCDSTRNVHVLLEPLNSILITYNSLENILRNMNRIETVRRYVRTLGWTNSTQHVDDLF